MSANLETIRLPGGVWRYDPNHLLGAEGGFGTVFAGKGSDDAEVAVKRLKLTVGEAAHREIDIAKELASRALKHVLPILDAGQDAESDHYFVVMPRADKSLQDDLNDGQTWKSTEAAGILLQIAEGLSEVHDLVHRDLKPANILWHDGRWKIADFGIARFVEAATSARTLKECLSPQYAAPEQWNLERSTNATDIYALGCIGHAVLTGKPPFGGDSSEELRRQHLTEPPSLPEYVNSRLRSLLLMMLRKTTHSRPSPDRVRQMLTTIAASDDQDEASGGFTELARAGADVAERAGAQEAERQALQTIEAERVRLAKEGLGILQKLREELYRRICVDVPLTERRGPDVLRIHNDAQIVLLWHPDAIHQLNSRCSKWDFVAVATVTVEQSQPRHVRSASLWYAKRPGESGFRWYEMAYKTHPVVGGRLEFEPFAIEDAAEADAVAGPAVQMPLIQIAEGPWAIDDEDAEDFFKRWANRLALAIDGKLHLGAG